MKTAIIVSKSGPVLLYDSSCPVKEVGKINGIFKDVADAALATGIDKAEIPSLADTNGASRGHQFVWPTVEEVRAIWPYKTVANKSETKPITVEVRLVAPPGAKTKPKLFYKSIMSCCRAWDLTPTVLQHIARQDKGWRDMRPPMMASAIIGVKPPRRQGLQVESEDVQKFFSLAKRKEGVSLRLLTSKPVVFDRVEDVPERLLAHSQWSR